MTRDKTAEALNEKDAAALRLTLLEAMREHTKVTINLARLLFEVHFGTVKVGGKEIPIAESWGFDDFGDYAEHELGIHMGPAYGYVKVYDELVVRRSFEPGALPDSITKLRMLAKISRKRDVDLDAWVKKSRTLSCCEMENEVDALFGHRGKRKNVSFQMKWNQIRPMLKRIRDAKEAFGVSTNGEALTQIVEQWAELSARAPRRAASR